MPFAGSHTCDIFKQLAYQSNPSSVITFGLAGGSVTSVQLSKIYDLKCFNIDKLSEQRPTLLFSVLDNSNATTIHGPYSSHAHASHITRHPLASKQLSAFTRPDVPSRQKSFDFLHPRQNLVLNQAL